MIGTGPPRLEKVRWRCVVKQREGVGASQGPEGGSHGHAAKFSFAGTWPSKGSSTVRFGSAAGDGIATGGGEDGVL